MLSILGFLTIIVFTILVMLRKMQAFTAIIFVPIVFAVIGGFGSQIGEFAAEGILLVSDTAVLLLFAILYFGIMMESGLFDPVSNAILKIAKGDPVKICMGAAILAILVALDGDGTTTYMIVCSAMLPVFRKLGINPLILATLAIMALGIVAGSTPWGGSATRAISVLGLDASEYFLPMLPIMAGGIIWTLITAFILGRMERKRLGLTNEQLRQEVKTQEETASTAQNAVQARKWVIYFNLFLTLALMALLIADIIELYILFIIGFAIALVVNYPNLQKQREVMKEHAANAIPVVSLVLAAGIFTGILQGTHMVDSMAEDIVSVLPDNFGSFYTVFIALIGLPLSWLMSNDAYFFGALPVLAEAGNVYGVAPIEVARASVIGQTIHLIGPTSAPLWVLIELVRTDLGKLQKFSIIWIILSALVMILFGLLFGGISIG
ncbi:damage-inducible protein CinA [Virgibacillus sp. 7505]|uniref:CitMHS family transporter n=1 Tax=Virgibacillus sp. 7505 TaxID=2022548 RepID=UPI000BA77658|nr:citrate:proton symporter [Virgibacillus sp. 7505]PAE16338.1 damage-inducible protein CinA [Virgibacillus sp. 7505]